ncbi:MAG: DUF4230 domain-containing protein [Scytolyngbya sp. HA4215-MV1]|jgi:hypothetical protein|nr:DUF4230 domain-containing protein [Scytolyngbya sp. HA4215-MV1]
MNGIRVLKGLPTLFKNVTLLTTSGAVLAVVIVGVGIWRSGDRILQDVKQFLMAAPPPPKVDVRSVVIQQIRDASELTTAVFVMEAVVPTSQDWVMGNVVVGKTRLLYIAYGEVRAGVDLSQLKVEDVQVTENNLRLRLPPPKVLDSKIDVNRSSVYDYDRGFLGLGPDVGPKLQELAQQEALKKITGAACKDRLLDKANDRAKLVVTQLLGVVKEKQIQIETQPASPNACSTL